MFENPNRLSQFWQELRRRKVIRVISIYAAAAFVILELADIVIPSLGLPAWTLNFIIILLIMGFISAVIFSWIFDIHPGGGITKTEPAEAAGPGKKQAESVKWKIAVYISLAVIAVLIILNLLQLRDRTDESGILDKSIAVLPFQNLSEEEKAYIAFREYYGSKQYYPIEETDSIFKNSGFTGVLDWKIAIDLQNTELRDRETQLAQENAMAGHDDEALYWLEQTRLKFLDAEAGFYSLVWAEQGLEITYHERIIKERGPTNSHL